MALLKSIFSRPRARRSGSPENPSTKLSQPDSWLYDAWGAVDSETGQVVTESNALTVSAWWAGVQILSQAAASLPLILYENGENGFRPRATEDPRYKLAKTTPNAEQTAFSFYELLTAHAISWGNGYAEIERDGSNRPIGLWPLLPDRTRPVRVQGVKFIATRIEPNVEPPSGLVVINGEAYLPPAKYIHILGPSFDGLGGINPVRKAGKALGISQAAQKFAGAFFGRGLHAGGVLTHPAQLSKPAQDRLRRQIENQVGGGLSGAHRLLVLEEGLDYKALGLEPQAAQLLESRRFGVVEVARFLNIPLHYLQDYQAGASYASIEAKQRDFYDLSVRPWLMRIEQAFNRKLLEDSMELFYEFLMDAVLRGDSKTRSEVYASGRQWGYLSANDVRKRENLEPIEGGDIYMVPVNMIPASLAGEGLSSSEPDPDPDPDEGGDQGEGEGTEEEERAVRSPGALESRARRSVLTRVRLQKIQEKVIARASEHFVRRESRAALRILEKAFKTGSPLEALEIGLRRMWQELPEAIIRELRPVLLAYFELLEKEIREELGQTGDVGLEAEAMVDRYLETFVASHVERSARQVQGLITDTPLEELEAVLAERFTEWEEKRADKIAVRDSVKAGGFFTRGLYGAFGVVVLRWVTVGKNCPICNRMDGETVGIQEPFLEPGDVVDPEDGKTVPLTARGPRFHPPIHEGCDCALVADVGG